MKNKLGFTLIELLVVVLIIGILAAIALSQYKKAVAKAQLTQVIMATKNLTNASQRFYLAQDKYPNSIDDLDITLDSNVTCGASWGSVFCYNEKFALWNNTATHIIECAAKTQDINSALASACKKFIGTSGGSLNSSASTCVTFLKLKPCYVCTGKSKI